MSLLTPDFTSPGMGQVSDAFEVAGLGVKVQPIEHFVLEGFRQNMARAMGIEKLVWSASTDGVKAIQSLDKTSPHLPYPYGWLSLTSSNSPTDSYNKKALATATKKVTIAIDQTKAYSVSLLPRNFSFEMKAFFQDFGSVLQFHNSWAFAVHMGSLKFTTQYGDTGVDVSYELVDDFTFPVRDASSAAVQEYEVTVSGMIRGYVSLPVLVEREIVNSLTFSTMIGAPGAEPTTVWSTVRKPPPPPDPAPSGVISAPEDRTGNGQPST